MRLGEVYFAGIGHYGVVGQNLLFRLSGILSELADRGSRFDSQIVPEIKNPAMIMVRGTLFFSKKSFIR